MSNSFYFKVFSISFLLSEKKKKLGDLPCPVWKLCIAEKFAAGCKDLRSTWSLMIPFLIFLNNLGACSTIVTLSLAVGSKTSTLYSGCSSVNFLASTVTSYVSCRASTKSFSSIAGISLESVPLILEGSKSLK